MKIKWCRGLFLLLPFAFTHCATMPRRIAYGTVSSRGEKLLEITSDTSDGFFRAAFEQCRRQAEQGFVVVEPPQQKKEFTWGLTGLVRCEGKQDGALAQKYAAPSNAQAFNYITGPDKGRQYFELTTLAPL